MPINNRNYRDIETVDEDNFTKEQYISYLDFMVGLTKKEFERLQKSSYEEVRYQYNMISLEKSDEMVE
ncbi:hypothetical protein [Staphylococcus equorum]|uniref:Uncharacterized protein n=1 Tax=Staphylococcus equorum TaxID=246432 RepID=A0AAP7IFD6_9STAP|nr:hypothetical protein [Staphylococcus equorum]OEK58920.1 hypothetical protein ASS94_00935 [Staphylococcus equorum]